MRFVHISDLHFNPKEDGRTSRNIRNDLLPYLQSQDISADELLITGDYRHAKFQKSEEKDIDAVVKYIKDIAKAVNITDVKHIHLVPGNHDCDREKGDTRKTAMIRKKYNPDNGGFSKDDLVFLMQRFKYFKTVCDTLYGSDNYWNNNDLHTYRVINKTVFLYLNTAIMHNCDADRDKHRLLIGNDCVDRLLNEIDAKYPEYPIIVLAHHSPDCFDKSEKEAIEDIFRLHTKVFLYLCGDAHESWLRKVNNHIEITMGCLKQGKNIEATFLYGDTDAQNYSVHHWVRAWEPYVAANVQLQEYFPTVSATLDMQKIVEEQNRIKNDALLPWLRNSPTINVLFPELFIVPKFLSGKRRKQYTTIGDIIDSNKHSHIIFTGEAGSGKTTLLRQIFLFQNSSYTFLYLHARALFSPISELRPYQLFVRSLLQYDTDCDADYIVLLDGIDEAYSNNEKELNRLINSIDKLKATTVWFGWRKDHLNRNENEVLRQMTDDIVSLDSWTPDMADAFVAKYADAMKNDNIITNYRLLVLHNQTIKGFTESPFQLSLLVFLLHNKESDPAIDLFFKNSDLTIFLLYDTFFRCWIRKEHARKTSCLNEKEIRERLWEISNQLYYYPNYRIKCEDTAVVDLLSFSSVEEGVATGFFHRSFCAFFLADKAFNAVKVGDLSIIEALSIPLRNDVTDFLRSAIGGCNKKEIERIQANLIDAYRQVDAPNKKILSNDARRALRKMDESVKFIIKNELIYLVTRMSDPTGCIPAFLEEIDSNNSDPYILLDLAYASTLTEPKHIALEYAKTLEPGSTNDLINRSWTIAYFGDVQSNPHEYLDKDKAPWTKAREARLKRFQNTSYKALRFRILDLPLMYCFYFDRDWQDINETDYEIIKNTDIENDLFSDDEKEFLRNIKKKILKNFEEHLHNLSI